VNRHGGRLIDAVVVLVLMATILSILDDTFADRGYLVAGMVPVVVLLAMALVARRFHEGGWWYSLGALVLFGPLGALVALREPGPYVVPTVRTVSRVLADTVHAPNALVSTVPPVDPNGLVMLVPYMIGFFAALPAAWLALATSRPVAPTVPLVAALVATIPLGVLVPTLMVPRGILIGILLLAWSAARDRRRETSVARAPGSVPAATAAVLTVMLVSGIVGLAVPDADVSDRVLLRGEMNAPLISDAARSVLPERRDDIRLFKVTGAPEGRRMRFAALDLYSAAGWVPAEESPGSGGYGTYKRIGHDVAPLHPGTTAVVRVEILPGYSSDWLPMLGELTSIYLDPNPGRTDLSDVRYNQATASALVLGGVDVDDEFAFESVVGDEAFTRRDPTREPSDDQRQEAGAFLDSYLQPFDRQELLPLERVLLLARYLRTNGTLRRDDSVSQLPDDLGHRMLGSTRMSGSQFQYSALMALGASRLGVAARVVTGATPGRRGLVDYGDVVSWVELQFADGSWRPLDPARYVGSRLAAEGEQPAAPTDADAFVQDQLDQAAKGRDKEIRPPEGSLNPDGSPKEQPLSAWQLVLRTVGVVLAAALVALLLVPVAKRVRRRRRRRTSSWSGVYVNGWQEVLDAARDRGTPVPDGWSRVVQATELGVGVELARRADAAVFAPGAGSAQDGLDFWESCQELRHRLLSQADRRHRWWSVLNPASLLAGWARSRSAADSGAGQVGHEDRRARGQQPAGA
jgi:hypothetical protein